MKRSLILLIFMFLSTVTLMFLTSRSEKKNARIKTHLTLPNPDKPNDTPIKDLYGKFQAAKLKQRGDWKRVEAFRDLNLNKLKNPADVFMDIDNILSELDIEYENTKMPDSTPKKLGDYQYYEYKLALKCTFEEFTQFIINLEKNDKIFIIHELIFDNDNFASKEQEIKKSFEVTIWAISFSKTNKKVKKK